MTQLIAIDDALAMRILDEIRELREELRQDQVSPLPEWVRVPEAAAMKGVSPRTIKRQIASGQIQARGEGKSREVKVR